MVINTASTNRLMSDLPHDDMAVLRSHCKLVDLEKGTVLPTARTSPYCWFPVAGIVSVHAADLDGSAVEVAAVGLEGVLNSEAIFDRPPKLTRLNVQVAGRALRLRASDLRDLALERPAIMLMLITYSHAFAQQCAKSALACARYGIKKRVALCLLQYFDRLETNLIDITHETLAYVLGVRRAGVSIALQELTEAKTISMKRSGVTIIDRGLLLELVGNGYTEMKKSKVRPHDMR